MSVGTYASVSVVGTALLLLTALLLVRRRAPGRLLRPLEPLRPGRAGEKPVAFASALLLVAGVSTAVGTAWTGHPGEGSSHAREGGRTSDGGSMRGKAYWDSVRGATPGRSGTTRTYYLGADEVVWDYAPTGANQITGRPFDETANTYVKSGPGQIGSRYVKCLYRAYSDGTFTTLRKRPASEADLGFLGPVIRAAVGDTIKVEFRNGCRFPASVHPHGVFYGKSGEGAPYADSTSGGDKADDAVPRGGRHTYTWEVPERAGPGPHEGSSVMWMYHSHTEEVADTYAGLQGFMVITARGMARRDGSPKDVDREVFSLFSVMNESGSPYLKDNIRRFASKPPAAEDAEDFEETNLMHSINGYVYGNQPMLTLRKGQHVRWYMMGMGTEVDLHTPHWHGNVALVNGMRMDVVNLLPATMVTGDMVPDNVGTWLFHCHVNDHLTAGMVTRYRVTG